MALGEAVLRIWANVRGLQAGLAAGTAKLKAFSASVSKVGASLTALGASAAATGAILLGALSPIVVVGAKFEKTMSAVKAVVGDLAPAAENAGKNFDKLRAKAQELGKTTAWSASQVAEAMKFLGLAGFRTIDILNGVEATLNLASAGALDLARASDIASDTLTAFRMNAADLNRVADVLAITQASANTTVEMLGESMKYAATVSAAYGQSLEDTAVILGLLGNAGLKASIAGTTFANMLQMLTKNADRADRIMRKYGLTFEDIDPLLHSITDIMRTLDKAGVSAADVFDMFGKRAFKGVQAVLGQMEQMELLERAINGSKLAAMEMATTMIDNVAGAFTLLKSAVEGFLNALFDMIRADLGAFIHKVTELVGKAQDWVMANEAIVKSVIGVVSKIGAFMLAVGVALIPFGGFIALLGKAIGVIASVVAAVVSFKAILIGLAVGAVSGVLIPVFVALGKAWQKLKEIFVAVWNGFIKPIIVGMKEGFVEAWNKFLKPAIARLGEAFKSLFAEISILFQTMGQGDGIFKKIASVITSMVVIAVAALVHIIEVLVVVVKSAVQSFTAWNDDLIRMGRRFGWWTDKVKTSTELLAEQKKQAAETTSQFGDLAAQVEKNIHANKNKVASQQKIIGLLQTQSRWTVNELNQLEEELAKHGDLKTAIDDQVKERQKDVDALKQLIDAKKTLGISAAAEEKQLKAAKSLLSDASSAQKRFNEDTKDLVREQYLSVDAVRAAKAEMQAHTEMMEAAEQAQGRLKTGTEKFNELYKELTQQSLEGFAGEIQKIEETRVAQIELTKARIADLQAIRTRMVVQRKAADEDIATHIAELEAERAAVSASGKTTAEIDANIKKLSAARKAASEESAAEIDKIDGDIRQAATALGLIEKRAAENIAKSLQKQSDARRKHLRQMQIDDLKAREETVAAARLESDALLEEEQKRIDKLFATHAKMSPEEIARVENQRAEAIALARNKAAKIIEKAEEDQADKKEKKLTVAAREKKLETDVTSQLVKRVQTVQDLYILYQALANIRQAQEMRAWRAADAALKMEQQIVTMKERRTKAEALGNDAEATRLNNLIQQREQQALFARSIAGKRAGEAGLEGMAHAGMSQEQAQLKNVLDQTVQSITLARGNFKMLFDEVNVMFGQAPVNWISSFLTAWHEQAPAMIDAVSATMANLKLEMDPTTQHSPSLVQVWKQNVRAVSEGVAGIGSAMQNAQPRLREAALSHMTPRIRGVSAGGFVPGVSANEINDNRQVQMEIHSQVDLDDVRRNIGNALNTAGMNAEGI